VVLLVAELALVLVLFTYAARIDPRAARERASAAPAWDGPPAHHRPSERARLVLLTELEPWACAIVAAVLAPTDAALGQAVVSSPAVPLRIRRALNVESGLNDGGSVPFLMVFIAFAAVGEGLEGGWARFALEQIGYGTLIGAA
jgi:sodium/hydrogen antiporter